MPYEITDIDRALFDELVQIEDEKKFDVFKGMFSFEGFIPDLCYTDYPANVIMCAGCFMVKYHNNLLR